MLWADEIVVVNSYSTDGTAEIADSARRARRAGAVQRLRRSAQPRDRGLPHEWIFSLDSDERCTEEVRDEILGAASPAAAARRLSRAAPQLHDGPLDPRLRLVSEFPPAAALPQRRMRYTLEPVHEGYEILSGKPLGTLQNAIWQFPFRNLEEVIRKMNRYSSLGVPKLADKRVSMASALGHGIWSFLKHYIFKRGFIDGWAGFVIAFGNFEGTFYRYAKRYEQEPKLGPPPSEPLRRVGPPIQQ